MALSLRGIPLKSIDLLNKQDLETHQYKQAQASFIQKRGEGTPLLPVAVSASTSGLAPYLRVVITTMLLRHVAGEDPAPIGETETRASAEAHLALIEVTAKKMENFGRIRTSPDFSNEIAPINIKLKLQEIPKWLQDSIQKSLIRIDEAKDVEKYNPEKDITLDSDPVANLITLSAIWRKEDPFSSVEKAGIESKALELAQASKSDILFIPSEVIEDVYDVSFEQDSSEGMIREQLLGAMKDLDTTPFIPGADSLKALVMKKFAEAKENDVTGSPAITLNVETVISFLENFDVMRRYRV